jgi:hypothetical protein
VFPETNSNRRPRHAGVWAKDVLGFYVEPNWVSERLFAREKFSGSVWDPACGIGLIPEAARRAGFLQEDQPRADNVVSNPPFDFCAQFVCHALALTSGNGKVAMIWLARRLNAARWLADTPLARIYLLTPRPSMPPGNVILRGEKPGGGTQDFCWLVWQHSHVGAPTVHWLHRDNRGGCKS